MSRATVLAMTLACGVTVANVYFPQALTPLLSGGLRVAPGAAAAVSTLAQLGYAVGILFVLPLGDRLPRRPLITSLTGLVAAGLWLAGNAPTLPALLVLSGLIGVVTVVPQLLIPMAADLSDARDRGRVVGLLQGGLLGGVLLARAFGGLLGQWLGWRAPYLVAAVTAALLAIVLAVLLPAGPRPVTSGPPGSRARRSYPALLAGSVRLLREQPALRRSGTYQLAMFGAFTAAWTSVALLLTGPSYRYGTGVAGLVAVVGAASVLGVPAAGRIIDRRGPDVVNLCCFAGAAVAAVLLLTGLLGGTAGLLGLIAGLLVLDVSVQSSQVANQARIFALLPGARSRLNSVYMTCVFAGGSLGSWLGARAYLWLGWGAVCGLVGCAALVAFARHLPYLPRRTAAGTGEPGVSGPGRPRRRSPAGRGSADPAC
jgi:predicted MFS family arabinose efflux permease